jgi:hypothetical protein
VKRFLFAATFGMSVLVFIAALSMWVRSYRGGERWLFATREIDPPPATTDSSSSGLDAGWYRRHVLISADGSVEWVEREYYELRGLTPVQGPWPPGYKSGARIYTILTNSLYGVVPGVQHWAFPGIDYVAVPTTVLKDGVCPSESSLIVRWWLIASLSALLPLLFMTRLWKLRRAAKRRLANLCLSCGYDLRASTDRCPECGTPMEAAPICGNASS